MSHSKYRYPKRTEFDIGQTGNSKCDCFSSTHLIAAFSSKETHIRTQTQYITLVSGAERWPSIHITRVSKSNNKNKQMKKKTTVHRSENIFTSNQSTRDTYRLRYFAVMSATMFVPIYPACLSELFMYEYIAPQRNSAVIDSIIRVYCICYSFTVPRVCDEWWQPLPLRHNGTKHGNRASWLIFPAGRSSVRPTTKFIHLLMTSIYL